MTKAESIAYAQAYRLERYANLCIDTRDTRRVYDRAASGHVKGHNCVTALQKFESANFANHDIETLVESFESGCEFALINKGEIN